MSRTSQRLPWSVVLMLTLTVGGVVGTLPLCGGSTFLLAGSGDAGYWQLAPWLALGVKAGRPPVAGGATVGPPGSVGTLVDAGEDAVLFGLSLSLLFRTYLAL